MRWPVNQAAGQQESYATKCTHQHATLSGQSTWLASEFSFHQTHFVFSSQILYFPSFFVFLCNWRHISFRFQVGWLGRMCDPLHWEVATFAMHSYILNNSSSFTATFTYDISLSVYGCTLIFERPGCTLSFIRRCISYFRTATAHTRRPFIFFKVKGIRNRHSSVGIATDLRAGVSFPAEAWELSLLHSVQNGPWGPYNLLFDRYRGLFPSGSVGRSVKLTTYFHK